MVEAKKGLKDLRVIYISLKNNNQLVRRDPRTKSIIESVLRFSNLDLNTIYDEIFDTTSYSLVSEYERFLKFIMEKLKSEKILFELKELGNYFTDDYEENLLEGLDQVETLFSLVKRHRDFNGSAISYDDNDYSELIDQHDQFIMEYNIKVNDLVYVGKQFIDADQKRWLGHFTINDFLDKLEYIYFLANSRLKELTQPKDVFKSEVMVLAAFKIFMDLKLIRKVGAEEFKDQFQFRDRKLTLEKTGNSKKYLARAIYKLKPFVIDEYQNEWEIKLSSYFEISSYSKIKNKIDDDNEKFEIIEKTLKSFEAFI